MGLGLPNMYTMQGTVQIKALLDHIQKDSMVGKLLHSELEAANLELGSGKHLFELDYSTWAFLLTDCWMKNLWEFCDKNDISLRGQYAKPNLPRQHDEFIMEALLSRYRDIFSRSEILAINRCRLYMQVVSLSDIATGDGTRITKKAYRGISDSFRSSKWRWAVQINPTPREWKLWRQALCLFAHDSIRQTGTISTPLGNWQDPGHQQYDWFYSLSSKFVYFTRRRGWLRYRKSERDRTNLDRCHYRLHKYVPFASPDIQPTTVLKSPNAQQVWIEGSMAAQQTLDESQTDDHWLAKAAKSISDQTALLLQHTTFLTSEEYMCESFRQGQWRVVFDGSFHSSSSIGTAAVIIKDGQGQPLITSYVRTPGSDSDVNPCQSELMGIYLGCLILRIFEQRVSPGKANVTFGCDNMTAINFGLRVKRYSRIMFTHFDLLWEI